MVHGQTAFRVFGQNLFAFRHFRQIVFVDVEQVFVDRPFRSGQGVGFDIDRIHVFVFRKRERKAFDGFVTVGVGEVVSEVCTGFGANLIVNFL